MDRERTLEVVEQMRGAGIGERRRWGRMAARLRAGRQLGPGDTAYYVRMTRIYRDPGAAVGRSRMYHVRLSEHDERPPCSECGSESTHYCNMRDCYVCEGHLAGHDA